MSDDPTAARHVPDGDVGSASLEPTYEPTDEAPVGRVKPRLHAADPTAPVVEGAQRRFRLRPFDGAQDRLEPTYAETDEPTDAETSADTFQISIQPHPLRAELHTGVVEVGCTLAELGVGPDVLAWVDGERCQDAAYRPLAGQVVVLKATAAATASRCWAWWR